MDTGRRWPGAWGLGEGREEQRTELQGNGGGGGHGQELRTGSCLTPRGRGGPRAWAPVSSENPARGDPEPGEARAKGHPHNRRARKGQRRP